MSNIEVGDIVERVDSKYNTDYKDKIWCKTEYLLKYIKEDLQNGMKIKINSNT